MPFIGEQLRELIDNGGGGSCVITDLGEMDGHSPAQTTILELLKPTSVPNGKYIYAYYTTCNSDAVIAIAYKDDYEIRCVQINSSGSYRKFWYNFEQDEEDNQCFRDLGGPLYEAGNNISFDYQDNYVYISSPRPKLYAPTITISGLTLTIKNHTKNKDYVGSYDIYNADTNELIRNTKKTTVDCETFNIPDGTYNIAVRAKGVEFNGRALHDDSDYSNTLTYTHDNPPTFSAWLNWYAGTVDKSTITEITFDNTYVVTGNEDESWYVGNSSAPLGVRGVICYRNGTSLTIKPNHTTNKVRISPCAHAFSGFRSLTTINNLTALDTSRIKSMYAMFSNCQALTSLDVSNFDTSSVTEMNSMFSSCRALTLDCSSWDVDNVTTYTDFNSNAPNVTPPEWVN